MLKQLWSTTQIPPADTADSKPEELGLKDVPDFGNRVKHAWKHGSSHPKKTIPGLPSKLVYSPVIKEHSDHQIPYN